MTDREANEKLAAAPYKVVDRRRFTAAGEVKPGGQDALTEDRRRPVPTISGSGAEPPSAAAEPRGPQRSALKSPAAPRPAAPRRSQVDFMSFVASLATNAMAALGLLPEGQQPQGLAPNPPLAREYIEIIVMLEERTVGNITSDEAQSLRQLLADLRLQYVEATRPPQAPAPV